MGKLAWLWFAKGVGLLFRSNSVLDVALRLAAEQALHCFIEVGKNWKINVSFDGEERHAGATLLQTISFLLVLSFDGPTPAEGLFQPAFSHDLVGSGAAHVSNEDTSRPEGSVRRGRPKKSMQQQSLVRQGPSRPTRQNNAGYKHESIPPLPPRRTVASKAKKPDILRLDEMRRLGIDRCNIDPAELTDEKLLQDPSIQ